MTELIGPPMVRRPEVMACGTVTVLVLSLFQVIQLMLRRKRGNESECVCVCVCVCVCEREKERWELGDESILGQNGKPSSRLRSVGQCSVE